MSVSLNSLIGWVRNKVGRFKLLSDDKQSMREGVITVRDFVIKHMGEEEGRALLKELWQ